MEQSPSVRWQPLWMTSFVVTALLFGLPLRPADAKTNTTWQQAKRLPPPLSGRILYGELGQTGSSAFYRFSVSRPGSVTITLSVPTWSDDQFLPQLVLYQTDEMTIGPVLPMTQPPETLASVFPSGSPKTELEPATFIEHHVVQTTTLVLPQADVYYLAVYNAGTVGGRWRLVFHGHPRFADIIGWPGQWWHDHAWTGWTWRTLFLPSWLIALTVGLGLWCIHRPWQKKKKHLSPPRKKTV